MTTKAIPSPKGQFLLGNINQMRVDFLQFLVDTDREFGPVSKIQAGPVSMVILTDPDDIADVLFKRAELFHKTKSTKRLLANLLGDGLVSLEGDNHQRHRLVMQPAFHQRQIQAYTQTIYNSINAWLKARKTGDVIDVVPAFADLMLDIVIGTFFSTSLAQTQSIRTALQSFGRALELRILNPIPMPQWMPTKVNRATKEAFEALNQVVYALINERRQMKNLPSDLLTALITATDEKTGKPAFTNQEIRDEIATIFFAGYETTTTTLAWIWYLLVSHPEIYNKVRQEITTFDNSVTASRRQLPYLDAVIKETLRLYPAAWLFDREPIQDVTIGGYHIPAGQTIYISPYLVQRKADYFENPNIFNPDRFYQQDPTKDLPHFAYFPFGGGSRVCIGQTFAQHTTAMIMNTLIPQLELELLPNQQIVPSASATIVPKNGIMMRVKRL